MFGVPALRSEDPRFLRGEGRYLENIVIPDALRAVFVRSIIPHGRITGMEGVEEARSMPGVAAVFTADDLRIPPQKSSGNVEGSTGTLDEPFPREVLARDVVRYVGEPVAVVIADSLAHGQDGAELIWPDVDALDAVTDVEVAATDGAPILFPIHGTNVATTFQQDWDVDVLEGADVVASARVVQQRLAPVPMETNAIAVVPEDDGGYTIWCSTQVPFDVRSDLAELLAVDKKQVRIVAPDVGGGFGAKLLVYPEFAVVAAAAKALGRPVRWAETRSESMLNLNHGRAQVQRVEIGATRDGTVVGMRVEILGDMGAYPIGAFLPTTTQEMLSGVYAIPRIASRGWSVVTNTTPVAAYRGAGRPEATALVERAMDLIAAELGMDPVDVRRRNMIPPDVFPYTTASGTTYDIGDYERALDEALRIAGVPELRVEQSGAARPRRPSAAGHRGVHVRRDHRVRVEGVRLGRGARGRLGDRADRRLATRTGPRDGDGADRGRDPGGAVRFGAGDPLGQRGCPARGGDVGVAFAAGRRVCGGRARTGRGREGAVAGVAPAGGGRGRPHRAGERPLRGDGRT